MKENVETGVGTALVFSTEVSEDPAPSADELRFNQMGEAANKFLLGLVSVRLLISRTLELLEIESKKVPVTHATRSFLSRLFSHAPSPSHVQVPSAYAELHAQLQVSFSQLFLEPGAKELSELDPVSSLRATIQVCLKSLPLNGALAGDLVRLDEKLGEMGLQWVALSDTWHGLYPASGDDSGVTSKKVLMSPLQLWQKSRFGGVWDFLNSYRRPMQNRHVPAFMSELRQSIAGLLKEGALVPSEGADPSGVLTSLFD